MSTDIEELKAARELLIRALMKATGANRAAIESAPLSVACRHAERASPSRMMGIDAFIAVAAGPAFSREELRAEAQAVLRGMGVYARVELE